MATVHPESLTAPSVDYRSVTRDVAAVPLAFPSPRAWWIGFGISCVGVLIFLVLQRYFVQGILSGAVKG